MEKKDKVKEVKNLNKKDDYGNSNFIVSFENGDSGFFRTKDENASQFKVGEEATYIFDEKPKKDGTGTYTKISLPKPAFTPGGGGGGGGGYKQMSLEEYVQRQKVDSVGYVLSYAAKQKEFIPEMDSDHILKLADKWLAWSYMKFDRLLKTEK